MAEDFPELLDALTDADKGLLPELDGARTADEATSALDLWKDTDGAKKFDSAGGFTITGDPGNFEISTDGTNKVSVNELKTKLSGSITTEIKPPEVASALKDLGVKNTDSPDFQKLDNANKQAWANTEGVLKAKGVNDSTNTGNQITNKVGEPTNADDMQDRANRAGNGGKLNDTIENIKKGGEYLQKLGKFVAAAGIVGGAAFGALELFNAIKKHQNAMNGCWYINIQSGEKCKIKPLTCNESDTSDQSGYSICSMCTDITIPNKSCFNPCAIGLKPTNSNNTFPGIYTATNPSTTACANCANCVVSSDCSPSDADCSNCDPSKFNIPNGYTLKCVSVDFWGAADDLIDGGLGGIDNTIGKILKIIISIIIGIVAVVLAVVIIKFLLGLIKSKKQ